VFGSLEHGFFSQVYPCPASTAAGRSAPARSRLRRGHRRGGTGRVGPTGPRELFGRGGARRARVEHDRRWGGAAAVTARRRSRRRAGEQGDRTRARAPGEIGDAIPVLGLAEEVAEGCCRQ
jgi:hypothetical protein